MRLNHAKTAALIFAAMTALAAYAFSQREEAQQQAAVARSERIEAEQQADIARARRAQAIHLAGVARRARSRAESRGAAARAAERRADKQADAARFGLNSGDIRRNVNTYLRGEKVGEVYQDQRILDVAVWSEPEARVDIAALSRLRIDTPAALRGALGGHGLAVRLRDAATPALVETVQGIAGVRSAGTQDGVLQVVADEPEVVAPAVVRALVASGADVVEVRPERATLERVYFEVMGVTPGADALDDGV